MLHIAVLHDYSLYKVYPPVPIAHEKVNVAIIIDVPRCSCEVPRVNLKQCQGEGEGGLK